MQLVAPALGTVLYHQFSLRDDPAPLVDVLDALFAERTGVTQFCVPLAPRRERTTSYRRDQLLGRIQRGELASCLVAYRERVDADSLNLAVQLEPLSPPTIDGSAGYRYRIAVFAGSHAVQQRGVAAILAPFLALVAALAPRAGVAFAAETASYAHALASGSSGGLTPEQDRPVREVFYSVYELGDRYRGPEWGTVLGPHHVDRLGGPGAIAALRDICAVVMPFEHGGAYLQLTEQLPAPDDPELEVAKARLAARLAPLVAATPM